LAQYQFRTAGRPVTQSMPRAAEGAKAPGLKHWHPSHPVVIGLDLWRRFAGWLTRTHPLWCLIGTGRCWSRLDRSGRKGAQSAGAQGWTICRAAPPRCWAKELE